MGRWPRQSRAHLMPPRRGGGIPGQSGQRAWLRAKWSRGKEQGGPGILMIQQRGRSLHARNEALHTTSLLPITDSDPTLRDNEQRAWMSLPALPV